MGPNKARKRLACIRCVLDCVNNIKDNKALPKELCFVPLTIDFVLSPEIYNTKVKPPLHFSVWSAPSKKDGKLVGRINVNDYKDFTLTAHGEEFSNDAGDWIQLTKECAKAVIDVVLDAEESSAWILLYPRESKGENNPSLIPRYELNQNATKHTPSKDDIFGGWISGNEKKVDGSRRMKKCYNWRNLVEVNFMLHILPTTLPSNIDFEATSRLSEPLLNWSLEADEELVRFLVDHCRLQELYMGGASKFIESITASTEQESAHHLLDNESDTYWESDGSLGRHYIQLQITPGVIIQRLVIGVDQADDNYMPSRAVILGTTEPGVTKSLNEVRIQSTHTGDVVVLENATEYYSMIEIRIKECKDDGIDCRLHYVKLFSSKHKHNGLNRNLFDKNLVRYPKLESVVTKDRELLYRRSIALNRFIALFDNVIQYLLPTWEFTAGTYNCLEAIRQLLPLSRKRPALIENCLKDSQSMAPSNAPKICINRHMAAQHLVDPTTDPSAKTSIFNQLYEALRHERCEVKLDYRWPQKYDQWWECKFIGEGIIDQGGGFRDSISDLAEELCPSSQDSAFVLPLPFFVRSPNQSATSNVYRDCYVPNAECQLLSKFEWIGQLMGACLRGKENLVISLPPFIWKMLNRETLSFEKDYYTVDAAEVRFHETLQKMDETKFRESNFEGILSFTTVMANGNIVPLKVNGENEHVKYDGRIEFLKLVKEKRMNEFNEQIFAIRNGLEKVIPKAVLGLMTWQELERRICGDPEITIEVLKKSTHYDGFENESDVTIKYLWQALENFTNEDRSRFLRFVTGRRRLPTPLYISRGKSNSPINSLPESATCSHTLYLPSYSSAAMAEEKIRYAAYNCVAIDTDMSPWED